MVAVHRAKAFHGEEGMPHSLHGIGPGVRYRVEAAHPRDIMAGFEGIKGHLSPRLINKLERAAKDAHF